MQRLLPISIAVSLLFFSLLGTVLGKDPTPPQKTPELLSQGKKLYEQNCSPLPWNERGWKGSGRSCPQALQTILPTPEGLALIRKEISIRFLRSSRKGFRIRQWSSGINCLKKTVGRWPIP